MQINGDDVIFSTGKRKTANHGIIGLGPDNQVSGGYDDGFFNPADEDAWYKKPELTPVECVELADFMILRWQEFRAKYARR